MLRFGEVKKLRASALLKVMRYLRKQCFSRLLLFIRAGTTPLGFALLFPYSHVQSIFSFENTRTFINLLKSRCISLKIVRSTKVTNYMVYPLVSRNTKVTFWDDKRIVKVKRTQGYPSLIGVRQENANGVSKVKNTTSQDFQERSNNKSQVAKSKIKKGEIIRLARY